MQKKKMYVAPSMKTFEVEVESGFCAASVIDQKEDKGIKTEGHQIGESFDAGDWGSKKDTEGWK